MTSDQMAQKTTNNQQITSHSPSAPESGLPVYGTQQLTPGGHLDYTIELIAQLTQNHKKRKPPVITAPQTPKPKESSTSAGFEIKK